MLKLKEQAHVLPPQIRTNQGLRDKTLRKLFSLQISRCLPNVSSYKAELQSLLHPKILPETMLLRLFY